MLVLTWLAAITLGPTGVTPESIERLLLKRPADTVITELFGDSEAWAAIEAGVASGDPRWLKAAGRLYGGCDAGSCFGLRLALGEALARHPASVLAVAGSGGYAARDACSTYGYLSDSTDATLTKALAAVRARERAVRGIKDPSLSSRKQECLSELQALRSQAPNSFR